uniref:Retrotransposon gag domain-containing protein n=1 Tax=Cajanus cajan TaxID=3821 RepID=A0A151S9V3_CAJCA|nr:hypothetical protein KK1_026484 [Cajanus cajan]KYP51645.1 hypothetical protein KK1_026529 [Cajanus cajan]
MFDGTKLVGWITRAENYFEVQGSLEKVNVKLTKLSMEGGTIHWFNLLTEIEDALTWPKLKQALTERYSGKRNKNPFEELTDLQQIGSIEEYIAEYEYVSSQVPRLPKEQYLGYFMGGCRPELQLQV